ncbi:MAG TPA: STAS domain-containing protein [Gammaproteobacteria bacterium]|nr:STAS domain-containing protein [Gammaproteobacteria bacterium]
MSEVRIETLGAGQHLLSGTLTFATVPQLYTQGAALFSNAATTVTLDLQGVKRTDSAGLALLMEWLRSARAQNKTIQFKNIPAQMMSIARLSGLDTILPLT